MSRLELTGFLGRVELAAAQMVRRQSMPELTELEQMVADSPSVAYLREHELLNWETLLKAACDGGRAPSRVGKDWDEFARHIRAACILLSKLTRIGKDNAEALRVRDDLYAVLTGEEQMPRWERDELQRAVSERRKARGPMKVYVFHAATNDTSHALFVVLRQWSRLYRDGAAEHSREPNPHFNIEHVVHCADVSAGRELERPYVVVDPPKGIEEIMRELPRNALCGGVPALLTLPRNSTTCRVHGLLCGEAHTVGCDEPLHECLVVSLAKLTDKERNVYVQILRKNRMKFWRPRTHLRALVIADIWGGINSLPTELCQANTAVGRHVPVYTTYTRPQW